MFVIKNKKTGEFIKALYRDDGIGLPDLHMTEKGKEAKLFESHAEATAIINRFRDYGSPMKLEVVKAWGRRPS